MVYDASNIFARIIDGKVETDFIYENDHTIAINDINSVSPIHILIIPKNKYTDFYNFISSASKEEIVDYYKTINKVVELKKLGDFRLVSNNGSDAGQTIFHFHTHLLSGKKLFNLI